MEFNRIEHYDVFPGDVIVFWADISNPPEEVQSAARDIEPWNYSPNCFGLCVNYSFAAKEFYLVTDTGASPEDCRTIFYTDQDGGKHWFRADISQELLDQIFTECGKNVRHVEKTLSAAQAEPARRKFPKTNRQTKGRYR